MSTTFVRTTGRANRPGVQDETLAALAGAGNYRRWLAGLTEPWLGNEPLEVGSGTGDYAAEWVRGGRVVTVSEADPARLAALRARFAGHPGVAVRELSVPTTATGTHSAVVALNVVEHVRDDVAAVECFARLLRPGGHIVLLVPAFPVAMSRFDREIGHLRRYRRLQLAALLRAAGTVPLRVQHVNALGLPLWIVGMRLLGLRPSSGPALDLYDRVVPLLARAERRHPPPFGQSLFAVARRP